MTRTRRFDVWRSWAAGLKQEIRALYWVYRHPSTPAYVKWWVLLLVAYAASPIDLIPDFIPIIGYLDDLVLLPIGIWLAIKIIPKEILTECRKKAEQPIQFPRHIKWAVVGCLVVFWGAVILFMGFWVYGQWLSQAS